ncbi:MAG: hypothetical protein U5R31_04350 [Acidimicrobiia bacterium]|nr:hypothetical protein [Acidimicrobiia bacterium]
MAAVVLAATLATLAPDVTAAGAAGGDDRNRAVVVIDDGTGRTVTCVRFGERSITGLEALERTGRRITTRAFGKRAGPSVASTGSAVPSRAVPTCKAPSYWRYFRARARPASRPRPARASTTCGTAPSRPGAGERRWRRTRAVGRCGVRPTDPVHPGPPSRTVADARPDAGADTGTVADSGTYAACRRRHRPGDTPAAPSPDG